MANGSFSNYPFTSPNGTPFGLYCEYTYSQNINNNYTNVTVDVYVIYYSLSVWPREGIVNINGTSKSFTSPEIESYPSSGYGKTHLTSQTVTVYHNSDGTKSGVSISVSWNAQVTYAGTWYSSLSASTTVTLPTIPRSSSITSASNITLGNACSITWTPASSSFKYTIRFSLGNWSYTTGFISPSRTSAYTYTGYTISGTDSKNNTTIYAQLPNSTSGTMRATLTTYNSSGSQIGSQSYKDFMVYIPDSVKPSVGTITLTPQTYSYLLSGKNTVKVSVSGCYAGTGSNISSYTFSGSHLSTTSTTSTSVTSSIMSGAGTKTYTVTVTDTRGRSASKSASITCYAYSNPSVGSFSAYRSNSNGDYNESGTYLRCDFSNISFSSVNGTNDITLQIHYGKSGGSLSSTTALSNSTSTSGYKVINIGNATSTYDAYVTITDNYDGSGSSSKVTIFGPSRTMNVRPNGSGIAFGKIAEEDNLLESKWPLRVNGDVILGTSSQNSPPTAGLKIHDIRNVDIKPETFGEYSANLFFHTIPEGGGNYWYSGLHMQGWHDGYAAWELVGNAHDTSRENTLKYRQGVNGSWGDWQAVLTSKNYQSYSIPKPATLYEASSGNSGTVYLSNSAANYSYLEIYYMDNNYNGHSCVKIYSPNGKKLDLSIVEASDGTNGQTYIRRTMYTVSGSTITPSTANSGYVKFDGSSVTTLYGTNHLRITRVLGYN